MVRPAARTSWHSVTEREARFTFTVFTPTFNRAHTLPRVYESLRAQTFRDFEWLVVDDGSTDGTEALVARWIAEAPFTIRLIRQANQGKHRAHNAAVAAAEGALFLSLDSDDACVPEAMERLHAHWIAIPAAERPGFSAVTVLCKDQHGRLVGDRFPQPVMDSTLAEMTYRHRVRGEKWGFQRTDVLRSHPFTAEPGVGYVPEGIIWNAIGRKYRVRFVNEALRVYYIDGPSLTRGRDPGADAQGRFLFYGAELNEGIEYLFVAPGLFLKSAIQFSRAALHRGVGMRDQVRALRPKRARLLLALAWPISWLLWRRDRLGR